MPVQVFTTMPAQDLHYHTSSKLALVAQRGTSTCHTSAQGISSILDPPEAPVACDAAPGPPRCFRSLRCHLLGPFRFPSSTCHICPSTCTPVGTSVRTGVADSSGSRRRLPTLNTQRLRHFSRVGWDGAGGGLRGLIKSFCCCACQLVQSLAPVPNKHAGNSTLLSHMSLQHGDISISPRIEAISALQLTLM